MSDNQGFKYGKCRTDKGRNKGNRNRVRFNEGAADDVTRLLLERAGLPYPENSQHFYRGYSHDMLFIESHGVVVKIGETDIASLIHPAILQPLGSVHHSESPINLVIYPGIEHFEQFEGDKNATLKEMSDLMRSTYQRDEDGAPRNVGIVRSRICGEEMATPLLLDADNKFNGVHYLPLGDIKRKIFNQYNASSEDTERTMTAVYNLHEIDKKWRAAFYLHQPLRNLFWYAFKDCRNHDEMPNPQRLARFWGKCRQSLNAPQAVSVYSKSTVFNEHVAEKYKIENMGLMAPWQKARTSKVPSFSGARKSWNKPLAQLARNPLAYVGIDKKLKRNADFMFAALKLWPQLIKFTDPALHGDKDFMLYLGRASPEVLRKADKHLWQGVDFQARAFCLCYRDARYEMKFLKNWKGIFPQDKFDDELVSRILDYTPYIDTDFFDHINFDTVSDDMDILEKLLDKNSYAFNHIRPDLRDDRDFILKVAEKCPLIIRRLNPDMQKDPGIAESYKRHFGTLKTVDEIDQNPIFRMKFNPPPHIPKCGR